MKKVQVKISIENVWKQEKQIKDAVDVYMKRMIKDLGDKIFKYYIYIEYYDIVLNFARGLRLEKISNIIFSKEPRISKE